MVKIIITSPWPLKEELSANIALNGCSKVQNWWVGGVRDPPLDPGQPDGRIGVDPMSMGRSPGAPGPITGDILS